MIELNTSEQIDAANAQWVVRLLTTKYCEEIVESYNYSLVVPVVLLLLKQGMEIEMVRDIYANDLAGIQFARLAVLYCVDKTTVRLESVVDSKNTVFEFSLPDPDLWNKIYKILVQNPYFIEEKGISRDIFIV